MKKDDKRFLLSHTNLPNEITGRNHYEDDKMTWYEYVIIVVITIALTLMVLDQTIGAETVTNFIADLLGSLMG